MLIWLPRGEELTERWILRKIARFLSLPPTGLLKVAPTRGE